jgi:hypothetical protein
MAQFERHVVIDTPVSHCCRVTPKPDFVLPAQVANVPE